MAQRNWNRGLVSEMIWLWLFLSLFFVSPAQADCLGIFSPNTICGNNGGPSVPLGGVTGGYFQGNGVLVPPSMQTFGSYGVGVQLNVQDQTAITGCANVPSNGTSDSTPAIQCMILWINQVVGGGSLYFPCGTYSIHSTIVWGARIAARGQETDCVALVTNGDFTAINVPDLGTYTISSGTYNNSTGVISLTFSPTAVSTFLPNTGGSLSGLTGTGAVASLDLNSLTVLTVSGTHATLQGPTGLGATTITGGTLSTGAFSFLFEDLSIFCQMTGAPATSCVYVGDFALDNMARVTIVGGLNGLENNGADGVLVDLTVCGYSAIFVGSCVLEAGGNWYFHAKMDANWNIGAAYSLHRRASNSVFETSCTTCDFTIPTGGTSILVNDTLRHLYLSAATFGDGLSTNGDWTGVTLSEISGTLQNTGVGTLGIADSWYNLGGGSGKATGITTCVNNINIACSQPTAGTCPGFVLNQGDDRGATITMTSGTSCVMNWGHTWNQPPACAVLPQTAASTVGAVVTTTNITITFGTAQTKFSTQCSGL